MSIESVSYIDYRKFVELWKELQSISQYYEGWVVEESGLLVLIDNLEKELEQWYRNHNTAP